jgi:glycine dehydrogenase subunit 1
MATIYCSLLGKKGIRDVAIQNVDKTQYALSELQKLTSLKVLFQGPRFNELVIQLSVPLSRLQSRFNSAKVVPGLALERYYPSLENSLLLSFTETKSRPQIDYLVQLLRED